MADESVTTQDVPNEASTAPEPTETPTATESSPVESASVDESASDQGEPGGSSPQEIRARKEYRARRGVEKQLESERIERVRLEERLRTLEEVRTQQPVAPPEKIFTPAEVQTAIDAGQVTMADGMAYLAKIEARRVIDQERQAAAALKPFERAATEVTEYMTHLPWTKDQNSSEFQEVKRVYQSLVQDYGFANDIRTQRIALERVAGSLDKLKQRSQAATQTRQARVDAAHSETPAGGSIPVKGDDISKAPEHMRRVWDATNLTPAQRAKEWGYHQKTQARKAG